VKIERIEIHITDLTQRLQRTRSTGSYDTGAPGVLLGKPILVKIQAEGVTGYGQIRPLAPHHAMPDTHGSIVTAIRELYGPRMIGRSIFDLEWLHRMFDRVGPHNRNARAMLDIALHDAMGKVVGQPVHNLIGGLAQSRLPLEWSISMAPEPAGMVADARRALDEFGIRVLCLKAGSPKGWRGDVENFIAVREAVGGEISIGMDPNTGWTVPETFRILQALSAHRVDYLEQPIDRHDLKGMAAIRRMATGVPLMADESCGSLQEAQAVVAAEAADVLCIKLYKHGGILPALKIAALAEASALQVNCGGLAVQSQLEAAAAAHFYASRPAEHCMPAGEFIFGLGVAGADPLVPETDFKIDDGHVVPPSRPGLGITIDEAALQRMSLAHFTVS
jgi:L-alanine-DL-glutamate epimerase-like enolase superfamily enzyme